MKVLKRMAVGVFIVAVVLIFAKNIIAKMAIENGVTLVTGLPLKMGKFDVSLSKSYVGIENMQLQNPKNFSDRVMLDMPEIYVDYNLSDLTKGKVHLEEIRIDLKEFVLVKNAAGQLNIDALKPVKQEKKKEAPLAKKTAPKGEAPKIQIDSMQLRVGSVIFKDYSKGSAPSVSQFPVNLNERYTNISDPNQLVALIVVKVMTSTPLAVLTNFDLSGLQGSVTGALASSEKLAFATFAGAGDAALHAGEWASQAEDIARAKAAQAQVAVGQLTSNFEGTAGALSSKAKNITGDLGGTAKDLTGDLRDSASAMREKLKLPFGSASKE